jgi:hypothetical protein
MHSAIDTGESKDWRDESDKEAQTFALVATIVQEKGPDIAIRTFLRRHYCDDDQYDNEERHM